MIYVIHKPTDRPGDDSTAMVEAELDRAGANHAVLDLDRVDPFSRRISGTVIWACGLAQDDHQFEVLQALAIRNRVINTPATIAACASKVYTTALLVSRGIRSPETLFSASRETAAGFIERHNGAVYKPVYGYDGNGIRRVGSIDDLGPGPWYLQEYILNDRDYRVFVLDGRAVGAIERQSPHLTHNIHQGGTGSPVTIDPAMAAIASAAASAVGGDYAGVDLLRCGDGYTVLEVNGTPNWHCMDAPIPRLLADYLVKAERETRRN